MLKQKNTKVQGNVGIGAAISYFTKQGYGVSIPLTDSLDYDLLVDIDGEINKIQVKTTSYKDGNIYQINLSVKGGNQSFNTIKRFDNKKVDAIFALIEDGTEYYILHQK